MYPRHTASILVFMGYVPEVDFSAALGPDGLVVLTWYHSDLQPTVEEVEAQEKPWAAKEAKARVKTWVVQLNGRAYEHAANSDDFDNLITHLRRAIRYCINDFAAQEGLSARLSNREVKDQFELAAGQFDLILEGKLAGKELRAEIDAMVAGAATAEDLLAYVVDDDKAAQLHAAAYPDEVPTLVSRLVEFPVLAE